MRYLPKNYCQGCQSHCDKQGPFTMHKYRKGGNIAFTNSKNHMIFVLSGSVQVRSESIGVFDCPDGQIILLVLNGEYQITANEDCTLLALSYIRSFQVCDKMTIEDITKILSGYRYTYHSLKINESMNLLVKSIVKYIEDDVDCVSMHNAKQLELFIVCRTYYTGKELLEFFVPTLDKSMYFESLVRFNHPKAKSVEELANLCGYSLHSFKKIFKYHFKVSPYQWMLRQNRNKILTLLLDNNIPIKAIAAQFGFTSQSHLNRYCNRYLGGTSSQIRTGKNSTERK